MLLMVYLSSLGGRRATEEGIMEHVHLYRELYEASLADGGEEKARDALRKQLGRDIEALKEAGVTVEVEEGFGG